MTVAFLDAERPTALTTAVLLGVADGLRASIPGNPTAPVLAHQLPLGCSESLTVLRGVEAVHPTGERCSVVSVAELVVLPGVNEFVPDGGTELPIRGVRRPSRSA